jgi:hypothetical protein
VSENGRTPEEFLADSPEGLAVYEAVAAVIDEIGEATVTTAKTQVTFRRRRGFAYIWRPDQYGRKKVAAALTVALPVRIESARFQTVAQPRPNLWIHHLWLTSPREIDDEVIDWLVAAYDAAA